MLVAAHGENKFRSGVRTQDDNKARRKREMGAGVGAWVAGRAVLCDQQTWIPGLARIGKYRYAKSVSFFFATLQIAKHICFVLLARIFYVAGFG